MKIERSLNWSFDCNPLSRLTLTDKTSNTFFDSKFKISSSDNKALSITDPDLNNGELSIDFPDQIRQMLKECKDDLPGLNVTVEYTIEKPRGGLQFIPGPAAHCVGFNVFLKIVTVVERKK